MSGDSNCKVVNDSLGYKIGIGSLKKGSNGQRGDSLLILCVLHKYLLFYVLDLIFSG
jgi:hypothetical protein